ncbi:MAG: GAF and ANTAR domain-containing protein [Actinomycetota bacterium]|nr:GAF and ANTAR domain-containing protein [Actinomycetota bacterium]
MEGSGHLAATMTALASLVLGEPSPHDTLGRVARLSAQAIPGVAGAGLTWEPGTRSASVDSSHDFARRLDQLQYRLGEGPGLQAYHEQQVVLARTVAGWPRWPRFSAVALEEGVRTVLAVPLTAGGARLGTLSLYSQSADAFDGTATAQAELFAEHAAHVLACARELAESRSAARNLREALASRAPIEQAKGILMAREHCDPQQAFDLLREASQCSHVKLSDIARLLVDAASRNGADAKSSV